MKQLMWNTMATVALLLVGTATAEAQRPNSTAPPAGPTGGRTAPTARTTSSGRRPTIGSVSSQTQRYARPRVKAYNRPAISPYLNLLRGQRSGRSFASEYFTRVRPQQEFRGSYNQLGRGLGNLQRQVSQQGQQRQTSISQTGHTTSFLSYGGYYQKGR